MKKKKNKAFHWAFASISLIAIGLSIFWHSNEPLEVIRNSQKKPQTQSQLQASANFPQNIEETDEAATELTTIELTATELDDQPDEAPPIFALEPSERLENTLQTLVEKITADNSELEHPILGSNVDYIGLRLELLNAIKENPLMVDRLLELFEQDPDSLLGRELAAVLSETGTPEAQTLALNIASNASFYSNEERAAALLMVSDMESITSETRDGLLGNIQQETDSDLTQFSLMALHNAPSTVEDYASVHRVLQETLHRDDANVRRHASYQIGEWASSDEDLAPLRIMAIEETDLNARVRAVMSLGSSNFKSTENKSILYNVIENDENALIRLRAWEALEAFPLSDLEKADYNALGERIQFDVQAYDASMNSE